MKEDRKIKNVVLIMLDTLQFNYLGCYGNKVVKTPNIDRLARQGFLFENAYSEGLPTVPVRRALMTGRFTLPYGGWQPLAPDDTTVADIMWGKNMQTALVYDTPPMRLPKYGYSRGFDFVSFNPPEILHKLQGVQNIGRIAPKTRQFEHQDVRNAVFAILHIS